MTEMQICGLDKHELLMSGDCIDCDVLTCVHMGHRILRKENSYHFYCAPCFSAQKKVKEERATRREERREEMRVRYEAFNILAKEELDSLHKHIYYTLSLLIEEVLDASIPEVALSEG